MIAVLKHELRNYFHSLTAYLFCAFLLAFIGFGAMLYNIEAAVANFELVLAFVCIGMTVFIPILTMRVITEEKKQKTDQLLYSLPLKTTEIILGKYLALIIIFLIPICIISVYPLIFAQYGEVYLLTAYGSIVAFFVMGAALIAIGTFVSSLTDNQGFAAGITIALFILNYYSVSLTENFTTTAFGSLFEGLLPNIMSQLSLFERFYTFVNGVFDVTAIVFYVTVIIFFLFLSVQSLEKRRYN